MKSREQLQIEVENMINSMTYDQSTSALHAIAEHQLQNANYGSIQTFHALLAAELTCGEQGNDRV